MFTSCHLALSSGRCLRCALRAASAALPCACGITPARTHTCYYNSMYRIYIIIHLVHAMLCTPITLQSQNMSPQTRTHSSRCSLRHDMAHRTWYCKVHAIYSSALPHMHMNMVTLTNRCILRACSHLVTLPFRRDVVSAVRCARPPRHCLVPAELRQHAHTHMLL